MNTFHTFFTGMAFLTMVLVWGMLIAQHGHYFYAMSWLEVALCFVLGPPIICWIGRAVLENK